MHMFAKAGVGAGTPCPPVERARHSRHLSALPVSLRLPVSLFANLSARQGDSAATSGKRTESAALLRRYCCVLQGCGFKGEEQV